MRLTQLPVSWGGLMKNHRKLLAFAALIVPLLACLVPNLDTEKFAKTRPSPVDLAGHYVPMAETLKLVKDSGAYPDVDMAVDINVDGTMTFTNLPDWWRTRSGEPGGEMDSGSAH